VRAIKLPLRLARTVPAGLAVAWMRAPNLVPELVVVLGRPKLSTHDAGPSGWTVLLFSNGLPAGLSAPARRRVP